MTDDTPDAVWIKNGKLITPVQNSEFAEKYHKSPPVVDVEALKFKMRNYFNAFSPEYESTMHNHGDKVLDYLVSHGIIQEKKT